MPKNGLLWGLRAGAFGMLVLLLVQMGLVYDSEIFNVLNILSVVGEFRDIGALILYIALAGLFEGIAIMGSVMFTNGGYSVFVRNIFNNLVGRWFYFPTIEETQAPTLSRAINELKEIGLEMVPEIYPLVLQIIVVFLFYFAIHATLTANPQSAIVSVTLLDVLVVVPLFIMGLDNVIMSLFGSIIPGYPQWFQQIVDQEYVLPSMLQDIRELSIIGFLGSPIFWTALLSFLYLEATFQLAYVQQVTVPTLERERRLNRQIELMDRESVKAIERIQVLEDKKRAMKEEERKRRMEMGEEELAALKREEDAMSLSTLMAEKSGSVGFSYIARLIAKKKTEREEEKIMNAMRDTRKVSHFLSKLFAQDKMAKERLTAKTAAPTASRLIFSTLTNMAIRIVLITIIAWACVNPYIIFRYIFFAPPAIANSVELQTVEGVLSLLIPFLLVIPVISNVIKISKFSKLQELLRKEEVLRKGLTEEEMEDLERRRAEMDEEVLLKRDQDALADQQRKASMKSAQN